MSRCRLLYMGWTENRVLLYSAGNYVQYPVISHNGKNEKEYTHTHQHPLQQYHHHHNPHAMIAFVDNVCVAEEMYVKLKPSQVNYFKCRKNQLTPMRQNQLTWVPTEPWTQLSQTRRED